MNLRRYFADLLADVGDDDRRDGRLLAFGVLCGDAVLRWRDGGRVDRELLAELDKLADALARDLERPEYAGRRKG